MFKLRLQFPRHNQQHQQWLCWHLSSRRTSCPSSDVCSTLRCPTNRCPTPPTWEFITTYLPTFHKFLCWPFSTQLFSHLLLPTTTTFHSITRADPLPVKFICFICSIFVCLKADSFVFENFQATCRRQLGQTQEGTPAHSGSHFLPDVQDHQNFLGLVMMSLWLTHHHSLMNIIHIIMSKMYHHNLPNVVEEGVPT